jgi:hypothetical protein
MHDQAGGKASGAKMNGAVGNARNCTSIGEANSNALI